MFLVWRGYGILVPVVVAVAFFVTVLIVDPLGVPASLGFGLSGLISAAVLWWFGRKVHDPSKDKLLEDLETGEMVRLKSRHDFFWIKIEHWAFILIALAALLAVLGVMDAIQGTG